MVEEEALHALEARLSLGHVLVYRTLAEKVLDEESRSSRAYLSHYGTGYIRSWLGWGARYLGYLPVLEAHSSIPCDAAIEELSSMLKQESDVHLGKPSGSSVDLSLMVLEAKLLLQTDRDDKTRLQDLVRAEAVRFSTEVAIDAESNTRVDVSLVDLSVHDLCSDPGISGVLLSRSPLVASSMSCGNGAAATAAEFHTAPLLQVSLEMSGSGSRCADQVHFVLQSSLWPALCRHFL